MKFRSGSYDDCRHADIVIVTAGVRQEPGEVPLSEKESGEFGISAEDLRANLSKAGL